MGFDAVNFLCAATRQAEAANDFVKNQERIIDGAFLAQDRQKIIARKIKTRVGGNRLNDYRGNLPFVPSKCFPNKVGIVEWKRDGEVSKCLGDARAVGLPVSKRATACFNQ